MTECEKDCECRNEVEKVKKVGKVIDHKPVGNQILVEMLSNKEVYGGLIELSGEVDMGVPQAYIKKIGPMVSKEYGLSEGDRVIVVGRYTPVPADGERELALVEGHMIKCILVEK